MKPTVVIIFLLLLIYACNSSKITYSWKSEKAEPLETSRLMVVCLDNHMQDAGLRSEMESHLVDDLKDRGLKAVSSMMELGPKSFAGLTEKQALERLQDRGADAVLTIVLLDKKRERYYVPGRVQFTPYIIYQRHFWGYYSTIYDRIYTPGYYMEDTRYFWETSLYDLKTRELVYTAQTESFDPASVSQMGHEYGLLIVNDLFRNNVLRQSLPVQ
jgi:hypothetical protein